MLLPQECSHLQPVMWTQAAVGNFYCITYIFYCMFTSRSLHCNLVSCRQNRKPDMHNCLLHKTAMNLFLLHPKETPNNVTYGLFYVIRQYFHSCFTHVAFVRTFSVGSYLVFYFHWKRKLWKWICYIKILGNYRTSLLPRFCRECLKRVHSSVFNFKSVVSHWINFLGK